MKETTLLHLNQFLFFLDISFFTLKFIFISFGNVSKLLVITKNLLLKS
jgi:hypothetical protein